MSASREKKLRRELREMEESSGIVKKEKTKKKKYRTPRQQKMIRNTVWTAIILVLVLIIGSAVLNSTGIPQRNATAVTVGEHKITPVEFNYFYQDSFYNVYSTYSSLWSYMVDPNLPLAGQECFMAEEEGTTWKEFLTDAACDAALQVYALYDAAQEEGFTLTQEEIDTINATEETMATYAETYGFDDADHYLENAYGNGCDMESYLSYLTVQQTASSYAAHKSESYSYDDTALRTYYDEHEQDFDKVNYRLFTVTTENEDSAAAKATADAMAAELDGTAESFIDAALTHAPEDQKEYYEEASYTERRNYTYSNISTDYADWLFAAERIEGESQVFATSTGYAVVMFVSRDDNEYKTANVRHILVQVGATGENGESTETDWATCLESIETIKAEWEASDMTEETFASMADEHSQDTGSVGNGGLYEDVYKGQMVAEFEDWCFDEARVVGDTGLVKTSYGYHLMYFSGNGDEYWKTQADSSLRTEDYNTWYTEYSAAYEAKTNGIGQMFTNKMLPSMTTDTSATTATTDTSTEEAADSTAE